MFRQLKKLNYIGPKFLKHFEPEYRPCHLIEINLFISKTGKGANNLKSKQRLAR